MAQIDSTANDFIGRGLVFPIVLNSQGRPDISGGGQLIEASMKAILAHIIGTRFMLGEFGGKLERLLQEPNDGVVRSLVKHFTVEQISSWEKRAEVLDVEVDNRTDYSILIRIKYQIKGTKIINSFTYPYYTQIKF